MSERIFRVRDMSQIRSVFVFVWAAAKQFAEPFEVVLRPI